MASTSLNVRPIDATFSLKNKIYDSLKQAIRTVNAKRAALHRLSALRKADPAPISGLDALLANQVFFYDNPARFTESVNKICDELEKRIKAKQGVFPKKTPRILVSLEDSFFYLDLA